MAVHSNRDPLLTRVRNTSGQDRAFGYLGTHGIRLGSNEVIMLRGNLIATLGAKVSARKFQALERDLVAGDIAIEQVALPVLFDPILRTSKVPALVNGVLGTVAPEWETGSLSSFDTEDD